MTNKGWDSDGWGDPKDNQKPETKKDPKAGNRVASKKAEEKKNPEFKYNPNTQVGKIKLKSKKERTASSRQWLERQLNDPYVRKAKELGYRSRAAFKLVEIDKKYKILRPGLTVVDLGAAPGGWSQVAAAKVIGNKGANQKNRGHVVAIDLQEIEPLTDVDFLQGDFLEDSVQQALKEMVPGPVDVVLSDMAASACGISQIDHIRIMDLLENVYEFALQTLRPGGVMVGKVLRGGTERLLLEKLKKSFSKVHHFKPDSSRKDSSEMFVVAIGFRHNKGED